MTQQLLSTAPRERPSLLAPIACLAIAYTLFLVVCGVLSIVGRMSMHLRAQLLGSGLEVMGPTPYFIYAIALSLAAWGLLRRRNWGRRLMIVICAVGVALTVPHISSAVIDERYIAMSVDGLQILVRVAIATYLFREADWFTLPDAASR
jgi:hypothetical protein